jgi:hypothetical protein
LALKQFYIKNVGPAKIQRVQQKIPGCWTHAPKKSRQIGTVNKILNRNGFGHGNDTNQGRRVLKFLGAGPMSSKMKTNFKKSANIHIINLNRTPVNYCQ